MSNLNIKTSLFLIMSMGLLFLNSCSKESSTTATSGSLTLEFEPMANGAAFSLNKSYVNSSNSESLSFSLFQYYISNIVLTKTDGTKYTVPQKESYFLIKHDGTANPEVKLTNIPSGDYSSVSFLVGVDSAANLTDPTTLPEILNPANGMHWSWSQGYIFLKAEGKVNGTTDFKYHLGLNSNLKSISLSSAAGSATVRDNITPVIHLGADVMKIFDAISVVATPTAMGGPVLTPPSNNIPKVFSLEHIHN